MTRALVPADALTVRRTETTEVREPEAESLDAGPSTEGDVTVGHAGHAEPPEHARPQTRGECVDGLRPCPFVSCRYHLYLEVSARTGAVKLNFPDLEPDEMVESCALDVAERGGCTLDEIGDLMNVTRECVRETEVRALAGMRKSPALREHAVAAESAGDARPTETATATTRTAGAEQGGDLGVAVEEDEGVDPAWLGPHAAGRGAR